MEEYNVYCAFDIEKHKKTFVNYLEVMIDQDGTIHYAVPSHQEYAIKAACQKLKITRAELCEITPQEYYCDWLNWLVMQTGLIAVWNHGYVGEANRKQKNVLKKLKLNGLYKGVI